VRIPARRVRRAARVGRAAHGDVDGKVVTAGLVPVCTAAGGDEGPGVSEECWISRLYGRPAGEQRAKRVSSPQHDPQYYRRHL
jgi:hypothetical protein